MKYKRINVIAEAHWSYLEITGGDAVAAAILVLAEVVHRMPVAEILDSLDGIGASMPESHET